MHLGCDDTVQEIDHLCLVGFEHFLDDVVAEYVSEQRLGVALFEVEQFGLVLADLLVERQTVLGEFGLDPPRERLVTTAFGG